MWKFPLGEIDQILFIPTCYKMAAIAINGRGFWGVGKRKM